MNENKVNNLIKEVWSYNLIDEIDNIREIIEKYPYIAMV